MAEPSIDAIAIDDFLEQLLKPEHKLELELNRAQPVIATAPRCRIAIR